MWTVELTSLQGCLRDSESWGVWGAQSVQWPTLGFSSGRGAGAGGWRPGWGSALSRESASGFSLHFCPSPHAKVLALKELHLFKRQKKCRILGPSLALLYQNLHLARSTGY